jgi:hypothetical protein
LVKLRILCWGKDGQIGRKSRGRPEPWAAAEMLWETCR